MTNYAKSYRLRNLDMAYKLLRDMKKGQLAHIEALRAIQTKGA